MASHVCRSGGSRCIALILIASVAIVRAEADPIAEKIGQLCPTVATVPDQDASSAAPPGALDCSPVSTKCHVVPMSVFCQTPFPGGATGGGRTPLTRHLVVMNANQKLIFNISQFEVRSKNKNAATPINGCTGDFKYLDRCIVSMSKDDAIVMLHMRDEAGTLEQEIDFSATCSTELTDRLQRVLRLFDDLPEPSGSRDHRVVMVTVPRETRAQLGSACASR